MEKIKHSAISINVEQLENLFESERSNSFKYTADYPSGHGSLAKVCLDFNVSQCNVTMYWTIQ